MKLPGVFRHRDIGNEPTFPYTIPQGHYTKHTTWLAFVAHEIGVTDFFIAGEDILKSRYVIEK